MYKTSSNIFLFPVKQLNSPIDAFKNASTIEPDPQSVELFETFEIEDCESSYESEGESVYKARALGNYELAPLQENINLARQKIYVHQETTKSFTCTFIDHSEQYNKFSISFDALEEFIHQYSPEKQGSLSLSKNMYIRGCQALSPYTNELIAYLTKMNLIRKGQVGSGSFSSARKFETEPDEDGVVKTCIVLAPISAIDDEIFSECNNKYRFLSQQQKNKSRPMGLFTTRDHSTYRMVVPEAPGIQYSKLRYTNHKQQIQLFIATIRELKKVHASQEVYIDLRAENIFYDRTAIIDNEVGESTLIDGGNTTPFDALISETFLCEDDKSRLESQKNYNWIAPECWSLQREKAKYSMDVFSLGVLMGRCLTNCSQDIENLILSCQEINPELRPSLEELEDTLQEKLLQLSENALCKIL